MKQPKWLFLSLTLLAAAAVAKPISEERAICQAIIKRLNLRLN